MNTEAVDINTTPAARGLKNGATLCLMLAWVSFIQPIPGLGLLIGAPLNLVAFILGIVIVAKGLRGGIGLMVASIVVTPIIWLVGLVTTAGMVGAAGAH